MALTRQRAAVKETESDTRRHGLYRDTSVCTTLPFCQTELGMGKKPSTVSSEAIKLSWEEVI